jgi:Family of unknown function (DUF6232)
MALISCQECGETVSTEAAACPHCGAPQEGPLPRITVQSPPPVQSNEETIYADHGVVVTTARVTILGTTYPLRNIASVRMTFTPPRALPAILVLVVGLMILGDAFVQRHGSTPAPVGVYVLGGVMTVGAILRMFIAKTKYHVNLSSAAGEVNALTSKNRIFREFRGYQSGGI